MKKYLLIIFSLFGIVDTAYLTNHHYKNLSVPCGLSISDCDLVLKSAYSEIFGVPLSLLGLIHYLLLFFVLLFAVSKKRKLAQRIVVIQSSAGFAVSFFLVYLQLFVIKSICVYCIGSAIISTVIFVTTISYFSKERQKLEILTFEFFYKNIFKKILFLTSADIIHEAMTSFGELLGKVGAARKLFNLTLGGKDKKVAQKVLGINFSSPVGLAAGFDYEAKLTQVLPSLGFGFGTVGTITNSSYEGNKKPRLGRLPKSKSLLVNKGFKSTGAKNVIEKLEKLKFGYPVGVSIGRTNSLKLRNQKQNVEDVVSAFKLFENSKVLNSYYELNISCPNLKGNISFYPPKNLKELLDSLSKLKIKKPLLIKMPIEKSNREVLAMLKVISKYKFVKGVILGNLQKNRSHPSFDKSEIRLAGKGNFSGKPTFDRSNELISLTYEKYGSRFVIVGCGGVFNALDAYEKIKRGASLVQLITGLIYEGPQVVAKINYELSELLEKDGHSNISKAVGTKV